MTDQTESASEYAELLADLDFYDEDNWRNVMRQYPGAQDAIRKAAAAIRALEAKVRKVVTHAESVDRAAGALSEALAVEQRVSKGWQETAEKFRAERDRLAGEVYGVRLALTNAQQVADELRAELAAAREDSLRLEHLFNAAPAASDCVADLYLRILNGERPTMGEVRAAIDAARRAGEGEK